MVSAIKVNGQRLHALAREGVVIDRKPRWITVYELSLRRSTRRIGPLT
jgi:tRNA pseudouridine55 synthase